IILTFITTYIGIWYSRKDKRKTEISLIDQSWLSIINTFQDNFEILKLQNYTLPINTNLYYFEGIIINTGNVDIDRTTIYKPLMLQLPEEFKIKELRTDTSKLAALNVIILKNDNSITFQWDLLKPLEHFNFEI